MNYRSSRLTNEDQLLDYYNKMGVELWAFANRTLIGLSKMKEYDVTTVGAKSRDLFIKVVCWLIMDGHLSASFNEEFTKIIIYDRI